MKVTLLPDDLTTIRRIVRIEVSEDEEDPFEERAGLWAIDSCNRVWRHDESMSSLFTALIGEQDIAPDDQPKRTHG